MFFSTSLLNIKKLERIVVITKIELTEEIEEAENIDVNDDDSPDYDGNYGHDFWCFL